MGASPRIIKRYANRKLYDTRDSRYVTLDQISDMIRDGEDVKVIDNSTKEDLTSVTLAQIVFEEEKRKKSFLPLGALRKIIQSGGESLQDFVSQLSEFPGRVFRRDDDAKEEGAGPPEPASPPEPDAATAGDGKNHDPTGMLREFVDGVQATFDGWHKRLDANINAALETVSPLAPLQKELERLRERIAELEGKLSEIEQSGPDEGPIDGAP